MMTVYLDANFKCHTAPAADRTPYDTEFFDGQEIVVEEYRIIPDGQVWVRDDGERFYGTMVTKIPPGLSPLEEALAIIEEALNE